MPQPQTENGATAAPAAQDSAGTLLSMQQLPVPSAGPTAGRSTLGQAEISWICRTFAHHQISAGALCNQLPKKPLLLTSFPPNHEPDNKIHRAAPPLTPMTTVPSLLVQMSPFTLAEEWLYVFLF